MKRSTVFPALLFAVSTATVAAPPAPIAFVYETANDVAPVVLPGACQVNIMSVRDARPSIGRVHVEGPLTSGPTEQWIQDSFDSLKAYGFRVAHSKTPLPKAVNVDATLIRGYTWFGHMRINGMVAMDLTMQASGVKKSEKFRAIGSKANIWGADSEFITALNYAVNHTMFNVAKALQRECAGLS